jgi:hypothetical protein
MTPGFLKSENARLAAVAVTASALTLLTVTAYHSAEKQRRRRQLQKEVRDALATTPPEPELNAGQFVASQLVPDAFRSDITRGNFDETIIKEMLARNYAFLGEEAMNKVRGGRVVVVGCGGVGSWAAVMLVRS